MPDHTLRPSWSRLIYALAALSILQWIIMIPLILDFHLGTSLACWVADQRAGAGVCDPRSYAILRSAASTRVAPFVGDFFFIGWNVFPILLCGSHFALSNYYEQNRDWLRQRFRTPSGEALPVSLSPHRDNAWFPGVILAVICVLAVYAQLNKQDGFSQHRDFLYWWSRDISPTIYYIRLFFISTNFILVGLTLWESFCGLVTLYNIVGRNKITPQVLDPMRRFGMQPFGVLLMLLITPWFFAFVTAILGWLDHAGRQGVFNVVGTLALGLAPVLGLYLIAHPLIRVSRSLESVKRTLLNALSEENRTLEAHLVEIADGSHASIAGVARHAKPTFLIFEHILKSSKWPLPRWFGPPALFSLMAPFLGALGVSASAIVEMIVHFERTLH